MVIDEWQGCSADECPYDKEHGDCENCSYLIRKSNIKQNFVPKSVLKDIKAEIAQVCAYSINYSNWEYAKGLQKAIEIIDKHMESEG